MYSYQCRVQGVAFLTAPFRDGLIFFDFMVFKGKHKVASPSPYNPRGLPFSLIENSEPAFWCSH